MEAMLIGVICNGPLAGPMGIYAILTRRLLQTNMECPKLPHHNITGSQIFSTLYLIKGYCQVVMYVPNQLP